MIASLRIHRAAGLFAAFAIAVFSERADAGTAPADSVAAKRPSFPTTPT